MSSKVYSYSVGSGVKTPAANYGRSPTGAVDASNEYVDHMADNNAAQGLVGGAYNDANKQSQDALTGQRGPQANENWDLSNNEASGAGGHQQGAIGLAGTLASGSQPSQAAIQLQSGLNQSSAMQRAVAAGARGSAALSVGGANANANIANGQQNAYTQGGILRSQEMATGRGLLGSALGQQRSQDQARLGQANNISQFNAQENNKFGIDMGNAAVNLGQAANGQSQQDQQWYTHGMAPIDAQSEADQAAQTWEANRRKAEQADAQENL